MIRTGWVLWTVHQIVPVQGVELWASVTSVSQFHLNSLAGRGFWEGVFVPWLPKTWREPRDATWELCRGSKSRSSIITTLVAGIIPVPVSIQGYLSLYPGSIHRMFYGKKKPLKPLWEGVFRSCSNVFVWLSWMERCLGTNMLVHLYIKCGIFPEFCGHQNIFPMDSWLRVKERNRAFITQQGKLWGCL